MQLFEPIFRALESGQVRYVAVGGIATVLHGVIRLTRDVDLVVDLDPIQARRVVQVLAQLGFTPSVPVPAEAFADAAQRASWIRDRQMMVLSFHDPRGYVAVNLFVEYPMDFEHPRADSEVMMVGDTPIRVASLEHLIQLKRMAGRPQDLLDIERLEQVRQMRGR